MRKRKFLIYIAFLAITLASCSFNEEGDEASSAASESLALSSAPMKSENSRASSSSHRVSLPRYSFGEESSSSEPSSYTRPPFNVSSVTTYYTVSIYQCTWVTAKGAYGNPRFDFSVKAEANEPLYSGDNDISALRRKCRPIYTPIGEVYTINCFYSDEECRNWISGFMLVQSNMNAYYYCDG